MKKHWILNDDDDLRRTIEELKNAWIQEWFIWKTIEDLKNVWIQELH